MTGSPLVGVVIPVHDGERFLAEALASVISQTYRPMQLIVVDDASTDASADVAADFEGVEVLAMSEQLGASGARQVGWQATEAPLLSFLDADDRWLPGKIESQVGYLREHPEVDLVLGRQEVALEAGTDVPEWLPHDRVVDEVGGIPLNSGLVRREVLEAVGFDRSLHVGEWRDWLMRVREAGFAQAVTDEVTLVRRVHETNLSHRRAEMRKEVFRSLHRRIERDRERSPEGSPEVSSD